MTLNWLNYLGIFPDINDDLSFIGIQGGQKYRAFKRRTPGDFSSASFPLCAAALAGGKVTLKGLEMNDSQGDKKVIDILADMGIHTEIGEREEC